MHSMQSVTRPYYACILHVIARPIQLASSSCTNAVSIETDLLAEASGDVGRFSAAKVTLSLKRLCFSDSPPVLQVRETR